MSTFNAGAIESTLTLNRSTWNVELRKVKQEIEDLENTTITVSIDADTDNAYIAMDNLERQLDFLDAQTYEPKIELGTSRARTKIREIDLMLEHLDDKVATVMVDADIANLEVGLTNAELLVESLDRQSATVRVDADVDIADALGELAALDEAIDLVDGREIDVQSDVDIASGLAEIGVLDAAISAVDGRDIDVDVDYDNDAWERLVGTGAGGGGHMGLLRILIYTLIALAPLLAVALASGFAAVIAIAGAMAAAVGPAVLLGGALAGLIQRFKDTDPSDYTAGMQELADSLEHLKDAYNDVLDAIAPQGFNIMADSIELVADILPDFIPLLQATAEMIDGVLDSVRRFTQSEDYDRMLHFFGDFGVDMLEDFLKIGGNLLIFFGYLFEAISPLTGMIMDSLVDMTADWAEWSRTLTENPAFQEFMDDAIKYGPMVLDMLGSLMGALINIGDALEPFAGPLINGLITFFDAIANMDTDQLTILLGILGPLFFLMQFGMPFVNGLVAAWPLLAGAVGVVFSPLGALILVLAGLAGVIYYLYTTNEDFRNSVNETWEKIRETVVPIVEDIWQILQDNWGPIKEWAMGIWGTLQTLIMNVMLVIQDVVNIGAGIITWIWTTMGDNLVQIVTGFVQIIGAGIQGFLELLSGIFSLIHHVLTGQWGEAWQDILGIGQTFIEMIRGELRGAINIFGGLFGAIGDAIESAWNAVMGPNGRIRTVWNAVLAWLSGQFVSAITSFQNFWTRIGGAISGAWHDVFGEGGVVRTAWNTFTGWLEGQWNTLITWLGGLGGRVAVAVSDLWNGIRDGFRAAINDVIGWWNNLSFFIDLPNKLPGLPDSITISTPNVPYLAGGGLVDEETLAVIGEGDEPEIVSPVSKMREVVREVIRESGSGDASGVAAAVAAALRDVLPDLKIDLHALADAIASRMLPNLTIPVTSDTSVPLKMAEEILFWLRAQGYGGKYQDA